MPHVQPVVELAMSNEPDVDLAILVRKESKMRNRTDVTRRRFLGAAGMALAASDLGFGRAPARDRAGTSAQAASTSRAAQTSFGPLKQIDAGLLNVGYAEVGPASGPPVLLLHGWPYDIHSYVDVAPLLASSGYRVIVPHLRGYGTTRFRSADTVRNGQPRSSPSTPSR